MTVHVDHCDDLVALLATNNTDTIFFTEKAGAEYHHFKTSLNRQSTALVLTT